MNEFAEILNKNGSEAISPQRFGETKLVCYNRHASSALCHLVVKRYEKCIQMAIYGDNSYLGHIFQDVGYNL